MNELTVYHGSNRRCEFWETELPICCGGLSFVKPTDKSYGKWRMIQNSYREPKLALGGMAHEDLDELLRWYNRLTGIEVVYNRQYVFSERKQKRGTCPHVGMNKRQKLIPARAEAYR